MSPFKWNKLLDAILRFLAVYAAVTLAMAAVSQEPIWIARAVFAISWIIGVSFLYRNE